MKRRIFAFIAAALMITSVAFAEDSQTQEDIMVISPAPVEAVPSYISKNVVVTNIEDGVLETTLEIEKKEDPEYTVKYIVSEDTLIFDANTLTMVETEVKTGDNLVVFTDSSSPATLSLPPTYGAHIIVNYGTSEPNVSVVADTFESSEEELVSLGNSLRVVLGEETKIFDQEGKDYESKDLSGKRLVVFYDMATRSLPPLTTPKFVYVLNDAQEESSIILDGVTTVKAGDKTITKVIAREDSVVLVPVRAIAEALGFTVEWDGELKAVMINSGMFSFQLGVNSYTLGRMMPVELSAAPELVGELTFVPFEFFTEILGAKAQVVENEVVLSTAE